MENIIEVSKYDFLDVATRYKEQGYDFLRCMTGVDWGEEGLGVVYHLENTGTNENIVLFNICIWCIDKVIKLGDNVHPYSLLKMANDSILIGCNGNRILHLNPNDNTFKFIPQANSSREGALTFIVGMFEDERNEKVITASQDGVVIELDITQLNNEKLTKDLNNINLN